MLAGPFYICWLAICSDPKILERYNLYGRSAFSTTGWSEDCDVCASKSCPINTGFAKEMKKFFIDVVESKVVHTK